MDHLQQRQKWERRRRKQQGVRRRLRTVGDRLRLSVYRSHKHIAAQVIDDGRQRTVAAASTYEAALRGQLAGRRKADQAALVGALLAQRAVAAGVREVVLDRGWYRYHGRIKALAEAARQAGLQF